MNKLRLSVVIQNFNSRPYLTLSMLNLYSAFKAVSTLGECAESRVLLIDNASSDGSYEKLCDLGKSLSKETGIDFKCKRLDRDLGNSFAIAYGFLVEKKNGANYILNMDNDFIILRPEVVKDMIDLAEKLSNSNISYHAITTMYLIGDRDSLLNSSDIKRETNLDRLMNLVYVKSQSLDMLAVNINYLNILDHAFSVFPIVSLREFNYLVSDEGCELKPLISSFVPATFTLYNPKSAPLPPHFYILGDDVSSGLEHLKRGFLCFVLPKIGGVHYIASVQKATATRYYFGFRNVILHNSSTGSRRMLYKLIWLVYTIIYSLVSDLNIKRVVKNELVSNELIKQLYVEKGSSQLVGRFALSGTLHGILEDHRIRKKIEQWINRFVPSAGVDLSDYLRLDYSTYSNSRVSLFSLFKYFLMPDKTMNKEVGFEILRQRIRC